MLLFNYFSCGVLTTLNFECWRWSVFYYFATLLLPPSLPSAPSLYLELAVRSSSVRIWYALPSSSTSAAKLPSGSVDG